MLPGTPKEPLAQRLYRELASHLADRLGLCPIHGTRLICPLCDVVWTGSAAEHLEVEGLAARAAATAPGPQSTSPWRCARCGAEAMCVDCCEAVHEPFDAGLTPKEQARFRELLPRTMAIKFRGKPDDDGDPLHEGKPHALWRKE